MNPMLDADVVSGSVVVNCVAAPVVLTGGAVVVGGSPLVEVVEGSGVDPDSEVPASLSTPGSNRGPQPTASANHIHPARIEQSIARLPGSQSPEP
jgi:hypothetical protein